MEGRGLKPTKSVPTERSSFGVKNRVEGEHSNSLERDATTEKGRTETDQITSDQDTMNTRLQGSSFCRVYHGRV